MEASVGGAAKLDSLESVSRILRAMRQAGYAVDVPESGAALIETIMERKAISEFRWTTVQEIEAKGGVLAHVDLATYRRWSMPTRKTSGKRLRRHGAIRRGNR